MRKICLLGLIMFVSMSWSSLHTNAQTVEETGPEIFVGYSNLQAEGITAEEAEAGDSFDDEVFGEREGLHGFNAAITGYFTPRVGLTGDFSYHQKSRDFTVAGVDSQGDIDTRVFNFLGGPTVRFPNESRVTPFVRALFGAAHTRFEVEETRTVPTGTVRNQFDTGATDFAMAVGGGLDVRLNEKISLRVFQFDYNPVFLRDRSISRLNQAGAIVSGTLEGQRQDNLRMSFGIVFK